MTQHIHEVIAERDRLLVVNAELLAALKLIAEWHMHSGVAEYARHENYSDHYYLIESEVFKARDLARAAITLGEQVGKGVK